MTSKSVAAPASAALAPGIIVESVEKNSEGEKAGLKEGDVILRWSRGDAKGDIASPFDLTEVEMEQAPRGSVTLEGFRNKAPRVWKIGLDTWGINARPRLRGAMLASYRKAQALASARKPLNASRCLEVAAAEALKSRHSELGAWLLLRAAGTLADAERTQESDNVFRRAVAAAQLATPEIAAQVFESWADSAERRGELSAAEALRQQAVAKRQKSGDTLAMAKSLSALGRLAYLLNKPEAAKDYSSQALGIAERVAPENLAIAEALNDICWILHNYRGELKEQESYLARALAIATKLAPSSSVAGKSLRDLGRLAMDRGDIEEAEGYLQRSLEIAEKLESGNSLLPEDLSVFVLLDEYRGELDHAEAYALRALSLDRRSALATVRGLFDIGQINSQRGDWVTAGEYYRKAYTLAHKMAPDGLSVLALLSNLGEVERANGNLESAEAYYRQSLAMFPEWSRNSLGCAWIVERLGVALEERGDLAQAEQYFRESLETSRRTAPGSSNVAEVLHDLGDVSSKKGDWKKAEDYYRQALAIFEKLAPGKEDCAEALASLAAALQHQGESQAAAELYRRAIDTLETQSARLGGTNRVRADFRASHIEMFNDYIDLLVSLKQPETAFHVLERSRAQTFLEMLNAGHLDIRRGVDPSLLESERSLRETLNAKANRRLQLLGSAPADAQAAALNKEIDDLSSQHDQVEGEIRTKSPTYANLMHPEPLTAKQVQQELLDSDTLLLEYALGKERSYLFELTPTTLNAYPLPDRKAIEEAARKVYELSSSRNRKQENETAAEHQARLTQLETDYSKAAAELSTMILGPVASQLSNKRLLIAADGALQYVSFAALPAPASAPGGQTNPPAQAALLIAQHEIVNLPSASVLAVLRHEADSRIAKPTKSVAVLADPVFRKDDVRIAKALRAGAASSEPQARAAGNADEEVFTRSVRDLGLETREGAGLPRLVFSRQEARRY